MRTNIDIDDKLMVNAMKACGAKTKKATVEKGLEILIQIERQSGLRDLRGKLLWEGSLDEMRLDK